jgi:hypothetical protein
VGEGGGEEKNAKNFKREKRKRRNEKEKRNWELIG